MLLLTCNNFETHLTQSLNLLRQNDEFTDVTLTCDVRSDYEYGGVGFKRFKQFKAHKIILSVASPYFKDMFLSNPAPHPIIMLRQIYADDLEAILHFIYNGEAHVREDNLNDFLATAKFLQIYGYLSSDECDYKTSWKSPKKKGRKPKALMLDSDADIAESEGEGEEIIYQDGDDFEYEVPRYRAKRKIPTPSLPKKKKKTNVDDGDGVECPKCGLTFWNAASRRNHEDIHESEKTNCDSCEKVFPHSALLAEHVKKIHTQHEHSDMPDLTEFGFQNPHNADGAEGVVVVAKSGAAEPLLTGVEKTLDPEEAFALLSGVDVAADGEILMLDKPRGGDVYLFNITSKETIGKRLKIDGYKWKNKNTIQFPGNSMSKTYYYARTPVGTLKDFYKHQYVSDDGTRVLIHYLGDEGLYKDFKRGITPKRKSRNLFKIKTLKPVDAESHLLQNVVTVYSYRDIVPNTKTTVQIHREGEGEVEEQHEQHEQHDQHDQHEQHDQHDQQEQQL